jgi:hypothetical protein
MCERGVPGGALNLSSTSYSDHGRYGDLTLQGKIPTAEPGIETGTLLLVVISSDHQATRLVTVLKCIKSQCYFSNCLLRYFNYTGQQNLTFFFVPLGKISNPDSNFNAEFKYVSSFSPSPTVLL